MSPPSINTSASKALRVSEGAKITKATFPLLKMEPATVCYKQRRPGRPVEAFDLGQGQVPRGFVSYRGNVLSIAG